MNEFIADRLRYLREKSKFTQSQLAKELDIRRSAYAKIELGMQDIKSDMIIKLSEIFGVSCDYILLGKNPLQAHEPIDKMICLNCGTEMKNAAPVYNDTESVGIFMYCPKCGSVRLKFNTQQ